MEPRRTVTTRKPPTADPPPPAIEAEDVRRAYGSSEPIVHAVDGVTLTVDRGEFLAVMGPSGSGKSTLLHCLAGLDRPDDGTIRVGGRDITRLRDGALTVFRRDRIGFVFQSFNLVPSLSARENIALPMLLGGRTPDADYLDGIVASLRLGGLLDRRPSELSGGQQQRVAAARALVSRPAVVFADEPTGALDSAAAGALLTLLRSAIDELSQTVVMVTHDPESASYADAVRFLADGRLVDRLASPTADAILERMKSLGRRAS